MLPLLDHGLCCYTSVVATGQPESRLPSHAVPSDHDILQRVSKRVAHYKVESEYTSVHIYGGRG
jgi:hypothetical protein